MDQCRELPPPLFRTEPTRAVACYLYQGTEALGGEQLDSVLHATAAASRGE